MRRHAIEATAAILGAIWLAANGVMLFYAASLVPLAALLLAFGALSGGYGLALALLLTTNTRRPAGIDPNAPAPARAVDPFGQTTDELRGAAMVGGLPYGRRVHDDVAVVKRLIGKFEAEDAQRPPPATTPKWALDLQHGHADIATELFPDPLPATPPEEL